MDIIVGSEGGGVCREEVVGLIVGLGYSVQLTIIRRHLMGLSS